MSIDLAAAERVVNGLAAKAPGLAVTVIRDGHDPVFFCRGRSNIARGADVDTATVFRIGSISKTYVALAFMRLVQQGIISLHDPVSPVLGSELRGRWASDITYEHLLTHTAGLGELRHLWDVFGHVISLAVPHGQQLRALPEYYRHGVRVCRPPGVDWTYANHGFGLLGLAIERLTGDSFASHLRKQILIPFGLQDADFERTPHAAAFLAAGYVGRPGRWRQTTDLEVAIPPAGSIYSTIADQARYVAALLSGVCGVLTPQTFAETTRVRVSVDPRILGMAIGFMTKRVADIETLRHDGGWPGFTSSMIVAPGEGLGVVALANASTKVPIEAADAVLRAVLGRPSADEELSVLPVVPDEPLEDYIGSYAPKSGGVNVNFRHLQSGWRASIVRSGDGLGVRRLWGPQRGTIPLRATGQADLFAMAARPGIGYLRFRRDERGAVDALAADMSMLERHPRLLGLKHQA